MNFSQLGRPKVCSLSMAWLQDPNIRPMTACTAHSHIDASLEGLPGTHPSLAIPDQPFGGLFWFLLCGIRTFQGIRHRCTPYSVIKSHVWIQTLSDSVHWTAHYFLRNQIRYIWKRIMGTKDAPTSCKCVIVEGKEGKSPEASGAVSGRHFHLFR